MLLNPENILAYSVYQRKTWRKFLWREGVGSYRKKSIDYSVYILFTRGELGESSFEQKPWVPTEERLLTGDRRMDAVGPNNWFSYL